MIASLKQSLKSLLLRLRDPRLEAVPEQINPDAQLIALLQERIALQERKIKALADALERQKQPIRRKKKDDPA